MKLTTAALLLLLAVVSPRFAFAQIPSVLMQGTLSINYSFFPGCGPVNLYGTVQLQPDLTDPLQTSWPSLISALQDGTETIASGNLIGNVTVSGGCAGNYALENSAWVLGFNSGWELDVYYETNGNGPVDIVAYTALIPGLQRSQYTDAFNLGYAGNAEPSTGSYFEGTGSLCLGAFIGTNCTILTYRPGPTPSITGLNPSSAPAGASGVSVTVQGTNFTSNSVVQWTSQNGEKTNLATQFASPTTLTAKIPTGLLDVVGSSQLTVISFTSLPSPASNFTIAEGNSPVSLGAGLITTVAPPYTNCTVPSSVTSAPTSDTTLYLSFQGSVTPSDIITNSWLAPNGTVVEGLSWSGLTGQYCFFGSSLPIGSLSSSEIGSWEAQVFDNGTLAFTVPFTVTAAGATISSITCSLPHFAAGASWTTGIFVVNTADQSANFSIVFHDDNGNPVSLPFTTGPSNTLSGSVPAQGSAYYEVSNPTGQLISGSAQVIADPSIVVQSLFRNDDSGTYYEAAVPSDTGSHEFLVPFDATTFAATGAPFYTGFAIANLSSAAATVTCITRNSAGVVIPAAVNVPALSPLGHWANYLFPALAGQRGTIDCTSNTTIAAVALRFIGTNAFSTLPVISNPGSVSTSPNAGAIQSLPHFAAGSSWTTGIFAINTGTQPANFSVAFFEDSGSPVSLPFTTGSTNTLAGTIPAQGSAYYEASDPTIALVSGSARITSDPSIVVQALFRNNDDGTYYEASVPSTIGSNDFLIPFDATTFTATGAPLYTGFAIANLGSSTANITCTARTSAGVVIPNGVTVPALPPLGHWANYLFPGLTGQRGTLDCNSNTTIAAVALRFIGTNAFSSLPVITLSTAQ